MSESRYELHKPILIIGFFNKKGFFDNYLSLDDVVMKQWLYGDIVENIGFKILSITPYEEHDVEISHTDGNMAKGYIANPRLEIPEEPWDLQFKFVNQYPVAYYGQASNELDYRWRIKELNNVPILDLLKQARLPWHYENLSNAYQSLLVLINSGREEYKPLFDSIQKTLNSEFDAWEVITAPLEEFPEISITEVKLKSGIDLEGNESVSGPTSLLPGQTAMMNALSLCDSHPDRLSVKRIVGECDSFGAEYCHMCQPCYDAYLRESEEEDLSGHCDWCKQYKSEVRPHRDFEEGSCGRVYSVCNDCIQAENKRVAEEMGDDDYDDNY